MDWDKVMRMWNYVRDASGTTADLRCVHPKEAFSVDENRVYHIHCPNCGLHGMTDHAGALYLGWIME